MSASMLINSTSKTLLKTYTQDKMNDLFSSMYYISALPRYQLQLDVRKTLNFGIFLSEWLYILRKTNSLLFSLRYFVIHFMHLDCVY